MKWYGFSGGANGSVFLSSRLPAVELVASMPCRYCLGGAGAYGPWNPDAMGVTITGNFIFGGGSSFSFSMGFVGNSFGVWTTTGGGVGADMGVGFSFFVADYVGMGTPTFNNYMGLGQSNDLNLGPFSLGQSADLFKTNSGY